MAKLKDIAQKTGVSIRTVTRALYGSGPVDASRKQDILTAARELGYRPNRIARSLKTGKKHQITAVISNMNELTTKKLAASECVLRDAGYELNIVFTAGTGKTDKQPDAIADRILDYRPGGVMLFPGTDTGRAGMIQVLRESHIPIVAVDPHRRFRGADSVRIDRQQGVYESVHYLAEKGYQNIAYLGSRSANRLNGYHRALKELNRGPYILPEQGNGGQFERGRQAAAGCVRNHTVPDAIQAYTDEYALGFLAGMHDHSLTVPRDCALVGFDNRRESGLSSPPLTTVSQPNEEVGRKAAHLLLSRISGEETEDPVTVILPTRLVIRETA